MGIASGSITSRQPPVKTRAACAARVCHSRVPLPVGEERNAAHRATYGGVWSVTYPRLSPRRDCAWFPKLYLLSRCSLSVRCGYVQCELLFPIPPGGTRLHSPRSRRVYASAPEAP